MFTVTLEKDQQGLGLTVAGYICEKGARLPASLKPNMERWKKFNFAA